MLYEYKGHYFKLKALRDYSYFSSEETNLFYWNIVSNLYEFLEKKHRLKAYNELTELNINQQNELILNSIIKPKAYKSFISEKH